MDKCSDIGFLDKVCSACPVQVLRISGDIFHGMNFGRLLYDPWASKHLKILFVVRDPRAVVFETRLSGNDGSHFNKNPSTICSRQRSSLRSIMKFHEFSPINFR